MQVQQKRPALLSAPAVTQGERLSCAISVTQHIVKVSTSELLSAHELFNVELKERDAQNKCFEMGGGVQGCLVTRSLLLRPICTCAVDSNTHASKVFTVFSPPLLLTHCFHSLGVWSFPHTRVINQTVLCKLTVDKCNLSYPGLEQCTCTGGVSSTSCNLHCLV